MALNYLSGRVSRFGVGVPGFSTAGDLTLAVSGAVGVETTKPRAEVDTPNISIRGNIVDSSVAIGSIGYFLSRDEFGVRWRASDPANLAFITVYDDGNQVGLGDFGGLNFKASNDETFITITPNAGNPEIADINFDVRWLRFDYGANKAISTAFGPDGTYASIPGYGTSEAVGVTSIGIGTIQPQDDFQVGIGSTGVTINGALGKVEAEIIKADEIEVDGNLTVESLIVRPGIATIAFLEVENDAKIPIEYVGFSSIQEAQITQLNADNVLAGLTTLGVGGEDTFVIGDLYVQGGIGTFDGDVYVDGDLSVGGELFVEQLNAENILITGVATVKTGIFTSVLTEEIFASGVSTFNEIQYNVGFGTTSNVQNLFAINAEIDRSVITDERVTGVSTISTADIDQGFLRFGFIDDTIIGVATVGLLTVTTDFAVGGATTLAGIVTTGTDAYVGNDLYVGGETFFKQINAINLDVSGVATIFQGFSTDFSVSGLLTATDFIAGFATITEVDIGSGNVGGIDFPGTGDIEGEDIDFNTGRIGILTGDVLSYGIGTIGQFDSGLGTITTLRGEQLFYSETSQINNVTFFDDRLQVDQNLNVVGAAITLGDVATDPKVGLTTIAGDAYVGNDLYVGGEQFINQLNATNLSVTGVATINNQLNVGVTTITSGVATDFFVEYLQFDSAAGTAATITTVSGDNLNFVGNSNFISGQTSLFLSVVRSPGGSAFEGTLQAVNILVGEDQNIARNFQVAGISTLNIVDISQEVVAISTINDLNVTGIATVDQIDVRIADVDALAAGIATIGDLTVTGVTTFEGVVNIDDIVFINQEVTGVSSITTLKFNAGFGTDLTLERSDTGIATIGLASITNLEATTINAFEQFIDESTVGFGSFGTSPTERGLYVTGVNTFIGFTTFSGDVFVDGDFTVTGIQSVGQLDADQSQIGILTVFDRIDSRLEADFNQVSVAGSFTASGISTIGLSTFSPDGDLNINRNLTVGGITTFEGVVNIEETSFVNQEVTGISSVNLLKFNTGIGTELTVERLDVGIATVQDLTVNGITTFNANVDINADITIDADILMTGIITATTFDIVYGRVGVQTVGIQSVGQLRVVGLSTFESDVDINATAGILTANIGIASVGFLTATEGYVGVLTSVDGFFETISVGSTNTEPDGTTGITSNFITTQDGYFTGILTATTGIFTSVNSEELSVTGVSTLGFATIGTGSTTDRALFVTGLSTFSGVSSFFGNVFIDGDLSVTGVTSFEQLDAAQSRIGILTVFETLDNLGNLDVSGITTLGLTTISDTLTVDGITQINSDLLVSNNTILDGQLTVKSDATFEQNVGVNSDINVSGITSTNELKAEQAIVGLATIGGLRAIDAFIDEIDVFRLNAGITTSIFANIGVVTTDPALIVTGVSTFDGFVNFTSDVLIEGQLQVIGLTTFNDLGAKRAQIGILTVAEYMTVADINQQPTGFSTLGNITFLGAGGGGLGVSGLTTTRDLVVTGFATFAQDLEVNGDADLNGNLDVSGITSLGAPGPTGLTTVRGDLYVAGDLFVKDDIFKDEITGRNALITGIATINNLFVNSGVATNFITTSFQAVTGIITDLTVEVLDVDIAEIDDLLVRDFEVTGVSTLGNPSSSGFTTTRGDLFVAGEFSALNNGQFGGTLLAQNVGVADQIKANTGILTTANIEELFVTGQTITDDLFVNGITTTSSLNAFEINTGILTVTAALEVGFATVTTLYVDDVADIGTLNVRGISQFGDTASFDENAIFNKTVVADTAFVAGVTTTSDLRVLGVTTTTSLNVLGFGTITSLDSTEGTFVNLTGQNINATNTLQANIGIVNNLQFQVGTGDTLSISDQFNSLSQANLTGVTTISDLTAPIAEINELNVTGIATVSNIDVTNGTVNVGLATVQELNIADIIVQRATRVITSSLVPTPLITLGPTTRSVEFTVTVQTGFNIQNTKINVAVDGTTKAWNEYSTVFTSSELATFDVVDSAGDTVLLGIPNSAASTRFTVYSVSHTS